MGWREFILIFGLLFILCCVIYLVGLIISLIKHYDVFDHDRVKCRDLRIYRPDYDFIKVRMVIVLFVTILCILIEIFLGLARDAYYGLKAIRDTGYMYEQSGEYYKAYTLYNELYKEMGNWQDIVERIDAVKSPAMYERAQELEESGKYMDALKLYFTIENYEDEDVQERIFFCMEQITNGG